jgi:CelD/BcsL family acetyltransferase involved in cellulose biosynthesis
MTQATQAAFERHMDAGADDCAGAATRAVAGVSVGVRLSLDNDLSEIEQDWRRFEQTADCTAFQTFDWLSVWHRHIGAREGVKPAIVIGRQNGDILFIVPLALAPGRLRRVTWFGEFLSNASAPLFAPDFTQRISPAQFKAVWHQIEQLLRHNLRHDLIDLDKIPQTVGGKANPMLALAVTQHANDAYLVRLTGSWDEFYNTKRSASWRKTDKKKRNKLAKFGDVAFSTVTEPADVARTIDALIAQKKDSYASLGVPNMFERPGYRDFYIDMGSDPARGGLVHVSHISVGGSIVAASFGLTLHGNYDYVLAGYSMGEMEGCSPGAVHLQELMRHFLERGSTTFDFNIGDEPYKREWCDAETKFYDYVSAATAIGWLAAQAMHAARGAKRVIKRNPSIWPVIRKARSMIGSLR